MQISREQLLIRIILMSRQISCFTHLIYSSTYVSISMIEVEQNFHLRKLVRINAK